MDSKTEPLLTKHLARNVPVDFNLCVERQRAALQGDLNRRDLDRRERKVQRFRSMIECLSDETLDDDDLERIDLIIAEVQCAIWCFPRRLINPYHRHRSEMLSAP